MDTATIDLIVAIISGLVKAEPVGEAAYENIKPYVLLLYNVLILGIEPTDAQLDDLQARRHALSEQFQEPIS